MLQDKRDPVKISCESRYGNGQAWLETVEEASSRTADHSFAAQRGLPQWTCKIRC
jgi:hypothetical protein